VTRRKDRIPVVLDSNVIVRALMDPRGRSPSARTYRLWLQRKLQLVVSGAVKAEYLDVLARLGLRQTLVDRFADRLKERRTVTHVSPGQHFGICRDPDDEVFLEAAQVGHARLLITNDTDLLEIPEADRGYLTFEILRPAEFMERWQASRS